MLQEDCNVSLKKIGEKTGLSSSTVHYRVNRLIEEGVVTGFKATVDPLKVGKEILAISLVTGRYGPDYSRKIGDKIALKLIKPEVASDRDTIERFSNEIRLARRIGHRNVCKMFDLGEAEGAHYITMEYVHGEDLKQLIRKVGQLSPGQSIGIARQVVEEERAALGEKLLF
jgi:serine/threonine-protein kinase